MKENEEYKKQLTEKEKEINKLKKKLKKFSEKNESKDNEEKEATKNKEEKKETKEDNNLEITDSNKESQAEKADERKKSKKKSKKKKKKDDNTDAENKEENKEENKTLSENIKPSDNSEKTKGKNKGKIKIKKKLKKKVKKEKEDEKEENEEKEEEVNNKETKPKIEEKKDNIDPQGKQEIKEEKKIEEKEEAKLIELQQKQNEPNYKEEYMKLKNLLTEYEQGNILAEKTKNDIDIIKNESLEKIKELRTKLEELTSINVTKLKEYESIISAANIELSQKNKLIQEYEIIALKQEDKIEQLNTQIYELNKAMFHKNISMKQNENYSNQLIDMINEHKLKIKHMKEQKIEEENIEISLLKRENKNLKSELEIEQKMMENMKINHQNLQRKYLNISYNNKKKEQETLLKQAEMLAKDKLNKVNYNNRYKLYTMNRSSSLGMLRDKKLSLIKNRSKFNTRKNEEKSLPHITYGNKTSENGNLVKLTAKETNKKIIDDDFASNMDEINEKLKQIIDEN